MKKSVLFLFISLMFPFIVCAQGMIDVYIVDSDGPVSSANIYHVMKRLPNIFLGQMNRIKGKSL